MVNRPEGILNGKMGKWILSVIILISALASPSLAQPTAKFNQTVKTEIVTTSSSVNAKRVAYFKKKSVLSCNTFQHGHYQLASILYEQSIVTWLIENFRDLQTYIRRPISRTFKLLRADDYIVSILKDSFLS
jgi:hypothetical protein